MAGGVLRPLFDVPTSRGTDTAASGRGRDDRLSRLERVIRPIWHPPTRYGKYLASCIRQILGQFTDVAWDGFYAVPRKAGNYLYMAGDDYFSVADVSNPAAPALVGSLSAVNIGGTHALIVDGDYAYIGGVGAGLFYVVDISAPATPTLVTSIAVVGEAITDNMVKVGNYIYGKTDAASGGSIFAIDVSIPTSPSVAGTLADATNRPGVQLVGWDGTVVVDGNYLYTCSYDTSSLIVYDISNPASISVAGAVSDPYPGSFQGPRSKIVKEGNYVYASAYWGGSVVVFDVSNPASPSIAGTTGIAGVPGYPYNGFLKIGNYVYVACFDSSDGHLAVVDVSDPANPTLADSYTSVDLLYLSSQVHQVDDNTIMVGSYYGACGDDCGSIFLFDISDPTAIVATQVPLESTYPMYSFVVDGDYAYLLINPFVGGYTTGLAVVQLCAGVLTIPEPDLVLEFDTSLGDLTIQVPLGGTVAVTIDWGDATSNAYTTAGVKSHTYSSGGIYEVRVSGTLTRFGGFAVRPELTRCLSFGRIGLTSLAGAFGFCANLTEVPSALPTTSAVTSMNGMFQEAHSFNQDISGWDVSSVTDMEGMFWNANTFNQEIGAWDTSAVTTMKNMFYLADVFNGDISTWTTSAVTSMESMFTAADAFNQAIGGWDVSAVTSMRSMFSGADVFNQSLNAWDVSAVTDMNAMFTTAIAFNQSLNSWTTSAVTTMESMFFGATTFNGNITGWDTSAVTTMSQMFLSAAAFNQAIGTWDVSSVTTMKGMFQGTGAFNQSLNAWTTSAVTTMETMFFGATVFNGAIGAWDTSAVLSMKGMFQATGAFNQSLNSWTTSAVTTMENMFYLASVFNGAVGAWDVSSVTTMKWMFYLATAFDQDLGGWDVSAVTDMTFMFLGDTLSTANYDSLLIGWAALTVQSFVTFHGGYSTFSAAATASWVALQSPPYYWSIIDGGLA